MKLKKDQFKIPKHLLNYPLSYIEHTISAIWLTTIYNAC